MSFVIMFLTLFGLILNAVTKACLVLTGVKMKTANIVSLLFSTIVILILFLFIMLVF